MPVVRRIDRNGPYYQWGSTGAKYYYIPNNYKSRLISKYKAAKQGAAIRAKGSQ
jgi:hypothetical protein